jgi:leucyl aminopeptidase
MSIKINFKNDSKKKISSNLVLFVDEKFSINPIKNHITNIEYNYISDLLKVSNLTKNLIVFELSSKKKIILVSIKKKN